MSLPRRRPPRRSERGSAAPLLLALMAVVVLGVAGATRVGEAAVQRARADATADVVALAGAIGGDAAARDVARLNGADVGHLRVRTDGAVQVRIEREGVAARAAALAVDGAPHPGG